MNKKVTFAIIIFSVLVLSTVAFVLAKQNNGNGNNEKHKLTKAEKDATKQIHKQAILEKQAQQRASKLFREQIRIEENLQQVQIARLRQQYQSTQITPTLPGGVQ